MIQEPHFPWIRMNEAAVICIEKEKYHIKIGNDFEKDWGKLDRQHTLLGMRKPDRRFHRE